MIINPNAGLMTTDSLESHQFHKQDITTDTFSWGKPTYHLKSFTITHWLICLSWDLSKGNLSLDREETGVQPTVTFPIGDHVNVLHDYK